MILHKSFCIWVLFITFPMIVHSQQAIIVRGEYTYLVPENITTEEAKRIALERAITSCLANEFGTIVTANNSTIMQTSNGKTDMHNYSVGTTEVKGEWLGNIKEPTYSIDYQNGMLTISVKVCGKARKILQYEADLSVKILCNGADERYERDVVYEGDRFYVSFLSSQKGYLSMYLIDEDANAMCLLPYEADTVGSYQVEANEKYVFFSVEHAKSNDIVDELAISCSRDNEMNMLYVIYSPTKFSKPLELFDSNQIISQLKLDEWLLKNRMHDANMQLIRKNIIIKKVQ